jgi:hypothetical protein
MLNRSRIIAALLLGVLVTPRAFGHGESVINVGRNGEGFLKVELNFEPPLALRRSPFPGISGYATGSLGIHSVFFDDPFNDLFQLSTSADFRFILLAKDPGMEVWNDHGSAFMTNGESFFIGHPIFDNHPVWNLVSGTPGNSYSLTIKFHDANGIYPDSDPLVLSFTSIAPPQLSIQDNGDDTVTVSFIGSPNEQYVVQSSTNLAPAAVWSNVSTNTADSDGFWTYTTYKSGAAQQFFRAVARPQ